MPSDMISLRARTIAIVGAGPSGVIAAKYLGAEKAFDKIVLFEQRDRPGGIWNYTGDQTNEDLFSIPQTNPHKGHQTPTWNPAPNPSSSNHNAETSTDKVPSFLSPLYESLETNIPRGLMGFQDLSWPPESQLFPTHQTVLKYISDYSADVQNLVQYETQVTNIVPADTNPTGPWTLTTLNIRTGEFTTSNFDAVIVANGHFIVPYVPDIPGIQDWNARYPGRITHSKYFRRAADYTGKKVIVVGNSASGSDISNQIAAHSALPLLWSTRSASLFSGTHGSSNNERKEVPPISRFVPDARSVVFADGTIERDVDAVVFATGYFYSLPFLNDVTPPLIPEDGGSYVNNTYQHLIYHPRPTLSLLALPQRVIPFPLAEAQAAVLARVYSGRLALPPSSEMAAWERARVDATRADPRTFHLLPFPADAEYINALSRWALSAEKRDALENEGQGKIPPVWGDWEFWCRERFPAIRRAFGELGERRGEVRRIEQVGFDYREWVREGEGEGEKEQEGVGKEEEKII